jgi:pilus assembly protein CpaE
VVIGPQASMPVATDLAQRYRLERPSLGIVLMRERVDTNVLSESLRAGIRNVVPADDVEGLTAACRRSIALSGMLRGSLQTDQGRTLGKIILVFGAKGGCGKTTIATNLAAALADLDKGKVCLVDFDLDFGDVAIFLQRDPVVTISNAVQMQGELDVRAVESLITRYSDRLDTVLAPTKPADAEFIKPELAMDLLRNLQTMYSYVVVDAPPSFSEITLRTFDVADTYILVTTLDLPSLKNLKVALETLDALGYPRSKWQVVLNRSDAQVGLTIVDVEEVLGVPIVGAIPSSRDVPAALNGGVTIFESKPQHPVSAAIRRLAAVEAGVPVPPEQRRHWWRRQPRSN